MSTTTLHPRARTTEHGKALRVLREAAGMTLDQVASEAGVSASQLSRVETGKAPARPKWVGLVAGVIASHLAA